MRKFLSPKGSNLLGLIVSLASMFVLVGSVMQAAPAFSLRVHQLGFALQFVAVAILTGLSLYLAHARVTSYDLERAAEEMRVHEQKVVEAWSTLRFERQTFRQMSPFKKVGYAVSMVFTALLVFGAICDFAGLTPPMRMPIHGQGLVPVSRWISGSLQLGFAVMLILMVEIILKTELVDGIDKHIAKAFRLITGGKFEGRPN